MARIPPWDKSIAARRPPSLPTGVRNVTWLNRIAELVNRIQGTLRGVALGALGPDAAYDCIADDRQGDCSPSQLASGDWRQTNLSAFGNAYRSRRSLLWWEAIGERRDGHANADHPDTGNDGDLDYLDQINFVPSLAAQELHDLAREGHPVIDELTAELTSRLHGARAAGPPRGNLAKGNARP